VTDPWLHVMVPAYGESPFLDQTPRSWLGEISRTGLVEVTVVDDASPQRTPERITSAVSGIEYVRNDTNIGVGQNFQRCLELSRGEYTTICGSDDLASPGYVERLHELAERFPRAAGLMPGVTVIDDAGRPVRPLPDRVKGWLAPRVKAPVELSGPRLARSLLLGNWLYFPAIAWRTQKMRPFGFRTDQTTVMDLDLELRLVFAGESLAFHPERLFAYRRHIASVSSQEAFDGRRFREEAEVCDWAAQRAGELGWRAATLAAKFRPSSRAHRWLRRSGWTP
jgi:glycosyltransferase involved in cell wall biosynthesis